MDDLPAIAEVPLGLFRHHKGGLYETLGVVRHSETLEPMVLYRALKEGGGQWVRPLAMFFDLVEVEGQLQRRFAPIEPGPAGVTTKSQSQPTPAAM